MIAWLLRGLWLAALLCAAAAAWLAIRWIGPVVGPWFAALAAVLLVALVHPALIGCNFVASRWLGDRVPVEHRLTAWQALRTYDAEVDASLRGVWFGTPFLAARATPSPASTTRRTALLFLHGAFCNRAVWHSFMRDAANRGYRCEALTLDDPFASIDGHDAAVAGAIDALLAAGAEQVALIGHSMGGLVARTALQRIDRTPIAHVFTLGTPHHGTRVARWGRSTSVRQMRRDSPWLAALAAREAAGQGLPRSAYTTIFSYHDDIVYPQTTGRLDGAEQIAIGACGHVALLYERRVRDLVFERLDALERRGRTASRDLAARAQAESGGGS